MIDNTALWIWIYKALAVLEEVRRCEDVDALAARIDELLETRPHRYAR